MHPFSNQINFFGNQVRPFCNQIGSFKSESFKNYKYQAGLQNQKILLFLLKENYQIKKQLVQVQILLNQRFQTLLLHKLPSKSDNVILQPLHCKKKRIYRKSEYQLRKNFQCSEQNCHRKYSSRIALNSHIRKRHNKTKYFKTYNNNIQEPISSQHSIQQTQK